MTHTISKEAKGIGSNTVTSKKLFYCLVSLNVPLEVETENIINFWLVKENSSPILNRFLHIRIKLKY